MADLAASGNARLNTVAEMLERLCISRATGYRLIHSGALRTVQIGRRRLVPEQAIIDYIASLEATS